MKKNLYKIYLLIIPVLTIIIFFMYYNNMIQIMRTETKNQVEELAKIYSEEGLCQVLFFQSDEECQISYKDKSGKYQNQSGITLPLIRKIRN